MELGLSVGWIRGPIIKYRKLSLVRDEMFTCSIRFSIPLLKIISSRYTIREYSIAEVDSFLFDSDTSLIKSKVLNELNINSLTPRQAINRVSGRYFIHGHEPLDDQLRDIVEDIKNNN